MSAVLTEKLALHVAKNIILAEPVRIAAVPDDGATQLIVVEQGAKASVFFDYQASDQIDTQTVTTKIILKENAEIDIIKYEALSATHNTHILITQNKDSRCSYFVVSLTEKALKDTVQVQLNEPGASCELYGLSLLTHNAQAVFEANVNHNASHTNSREFYKAILKDKAINSFNGKITIAKGAQKSTTEQTNHNLLLTKTCEVNTKPQLEIYADDVKASHAATVGQIDQEALFYLRSRGIDENDAIKILAYAFAEEIIQACKIKSIRERIEKLVIKKLNHIKLSDITEI